MRKYRALKVLKFVVFVAVALFVFGFVTMHLWNWLMPAVFGLRAITWAQALGLLVLSKLLFWGLGRGRHGCGGRHGWKREMKERWEQMSPEDRERVRAGLGGRWGCGFGPWRERESDGTPVE